MAYGRGTAQKQNAIPATIPASVAGINALNALTSMQPDECIYSFNILAGDGGMEIRDGYIEWANGWTGGIAKTIIAFEGNTDADDKLFVANNTGIWDVTTADTTSPTRVVAFGTTTGNAGICSYVNFTNDGNERFLLVCDGANGYYKWKQSTATWTKLTEGTGADKVSGVNPALFDYVMVWKERVWFIETATARAWYLETGVFEGTAKSFNFGSQFKAGGALRSMHNWTLDGGDGLDDKLVAISSAGDVIVFGGTDPASAATFGLVGSWFVGELPAGNRIAVELSGELYILSIQGLLPLSAVLNARSIVDPNVYVTAKISPYIRSVLTTSLDDFGWHVYAHPKKSVLNILSPPRAGLSQLIFSMYMGNLAWGLMRDLTMSHSANWQGEVFWTDNVTNRIYKQAGSVDKVYIDPDTDGQPEGITWDVLTAYQNLEAPAHYKRVQYVRPMFSSGTLPAFTVRAQYDFDVSEITGSPAFGGANTALWDAGLWNAAVWSGSLEALDLPRGANGMGRHVAVNIRGVTGEPVILIGFDVVYDIGGMM